MKIPELSYYQKIVDNKRHFDNPEILRSELQDLINEVRVFIKDLIKDTIESNEKLEIVLKEISNQMEKDYNKG
jgi:predicted transcriptional regulator